MTKKELIAELVKYGFNENEIKNLKNKELEELLNEAREKDVQEGVEQTEEVVEEVEEEVSEPQTENSKDREDEKGGEEILRETSHQLGIFKDYIYNVMHKNATVVVENLGYGDVYVDSEGVAKVGESDRLMFGETKEFKGVDKLYFTSASQPVVQIIEVK